MVLRYATVKDCTCSELVEITSLPVFLFFGGGKHGCWREWWEVTYSLGIRMGLERREQRRRWSRHREVQ
jgi:hypothetical protein